MISQELLSILACPACKADVVLKEQKVACLKCGRAYLIKNGIPVMIVEEAKSDEKN